MSVSVRFWFKGAFSAISNDYLWSNLETRARNYYVMKAAMTDSVALSFDCFPFVFLEWPRSAGTSVRIEVSEVPFPFVYPA